MHEIRVQCRNTEAAGHNRKASEAATAATAATAAAVATVSHILIATKPTWFRPLCVLAKMKYIKCIFSDIFITCSRCRCRCSCSFAVDNFLAHNSGAPSINGRKEINWQKLNVAESTLHTEWARIVPYAIYWLIDCLKHSNRLSSTGSGFIEWITAEVFLPNNLRTS